MTGLNDHQRMLLLREEFNIHAALSGSFMHSAYAVRAPGSVVDVPLLVASTWV